MINTDELQREPQDNFPDKSSWPHPQPLSAGRGEFDNDIFEDSNLDVQVKPVIINQQNLLPFLPLCGLKIENDNGG